MGNDGARNGFGNGRRWGGGGGGGVTGTGFYFAIFTPWEDKHDYSSPTYSNTNIIILYYLFIHVFYNFPDNF